MTITIVPASAADLPALLDLYAELQPGDAPVVFEEAERIWHEIAAQAGRTVLVAVADGAVAGTLDCAVLPNLTRGGRAMMLIENVVVASAYRRRGVGRALMAQAVQAAKEHDCYKVQLLSREDRTDAHAFYESCGLTDVAAGYRLYLDDQVDQP